MDHRQHGKRLEHHLSASAVATRVNLLCQWNDNCARAKLNHLKDHMAQQQASIDEIELLHQFAG
jgi:hypothetical protein